MVEKLKLFIANFFIHPLYTSTLSMTTTATSVIHALYKIRLKSSVGPTFLPSDIVRSITELVLCQNRDSWQQKQIAERKRELDGPLSWDSWRSSNRYRMYTRNKIGWVVFGRYDEQRRLSDATADPDVWNQYWWTEDQDFGDEPPEDSVYYQHD
jgi:hypothetical protein